MIDSEQKIAKIRSSFIGFEDHGILSVSLDFDYGGSGQGLPHRGFGSQSEKADEADKWFGGHAMGMDYIRRLLLACGVSRWEDIVGRTVLVTGGQSSISKVEPLPTERGEAFDIDAWAESWKAALA